MEELRILSSTAILGYGFPEESFLEGLSKNPHVIAADAGSTDPGPYYLGAGISFTDRNAVKRDLEYMIPAALERRIPVIIGSAGGCGAKPHVDWTVDIVEELARELSISFKLAVIYADISGEMVLEELNKGKVTPLHPAPNLSEKDVKDSVRIVGQMGTEPFIKALEAGADVIVAGRTYDPAVFAALAVQKGYDRGLAIHLGKILECAAIAATPGSGSDCMMGYLGEDYFKVEPLSPIRKCTTLSVAAHTLYEKTNPYILPGPGGVLDLKNTSFEQLTENTVKVTGSKFIPTEPMYIKLEGVKSAGFRTVSIAAARDPVMIDKIDDIISSVKDKVRSNFESYGIKEFNLNFKIYGKNGVMGIFPSTKNEVHSEELAIVIDAVAASQELANTICSFARSTLLHFGYEGRISTAGNLAFPFSPSDFKVGEVFEFSVYHLIEVEDPCELFPMEIKEVRPQ